MDKLKFKSTRGGEENVDASYAIVKGIAKDGGLFVPNNIPKLGIDFDKLKDMSYKEVAYVVLSKFLNDFTEEEIKNCIDNAYDSKFDTEEIVPIKKVGDDFYLELFHGPTLAFKDMALSILPYLMTTAAKKVGLEKDIVILTATSGDTGKAALAGFTNVDKIKIIVFYPKDGVSPVQQLQMITHEGDNTFVVGINGNFDDAQSAVKGIFTDDEFKNKLDENGYVFSSANSINIGRLIPQVVYYVYTYSQLLKRGEITKGEEINAVVPTGNFGNILAAYYAKMMGTPINKLVCASNKNNVLYDFINTGIYDKNRSFYTTKSPSMDILISSNLERLLYSISGEDSALVKNLMESLAKDGKYKINEIMKKNMNSFAAGYTTEENTASTIKNVYEKENYVMDTHTAVAASVLEQYKNKVKDELKAIVASTASPYKFVGSVLDSLDDINLNEGQDEFALAAKLEKISGVEIPKAVLELKGKKIIHDKICEKDEMEKVIKEILF
ncbi:threonine synthase [Clostridium sp. DL1XJH146]